jgi:hypothetical protein
VVDGAGATEKVIANLQATFDKAEELDGYEDLPCVAYVLLWPNVRADRPDLIVRRNCRRLGKMGMVRPIFTSLALADVTSGRRGYPGIC